MNDKVLIYEKLNDTSKFSKSIDEDGYMHLKGTFAQTGIKNRNQRIYTNENYSAMVKQMQARIQADGGILGELEHPNTMTVAMENASHIVVGIDINESGTVTGEIKLLHTPKGKIAEEIVRGGLPLYISSRAQGTIDKNGVVTLEELATYDIVSQPGFAQARLGLMESMIQESLSNDDMLVVKVNETEEENQEKNNIEENMNAEEINALTEKFNALSEEVKDLRHQLDEVDSKRDYKQIAESIQSWVKNEYTPTIERWVKEDYSSAVQKWVVEEYGKQQAETLKKWVVESMAPSIEKWIVEEYSDQIQGWMTDEYSSKLTEWVTNELAPSIEKWIVEEYSQEVSNWVTEEYSDGVEKWLEQEYKKNIMEGMTENRASKLANIDDILSILENNETPKPTYNSKQQQKINESANEEPLYIREMPAEVAPKWNMASEDVKESIRRKAMIYDLTNEDQITRFWNNIIFENIKPTKNAYEGLEHIENESERNLRMQLRRRRQ